MSCYTETHWNGCEKSVQMLDTILSPSEEIFNKFLELIELFFRWKPFPYESVNLSLNTSMNVMPD